MKWFKHNTRSLHKANVERLIMEHGINGYGLYYACIELIAGEISIKNLTFELEHDAELIAKKFKMDTLDVEKIMHRCIELGLFDLADSGRLRCLELAQMLDETISKNHYVKEMRDAINRNVNSGLIPDTFRINSGYTPARREEKRRDKKRKEKRTKIPPSLDELKNHLMDKSITTFTAEQFFDFYQSKNWFVGKNKMVDWEAAVRTWTRRDNNNPNVALVKSAKELAIELGIEKE